MSAMRSSSGGVVSVPVMGLHFMRRPRYTAKSYVRDGLVAMWDGIENAGWGTHSSSVGLLNLVGSAQLTFPSDLSYMSMGNRSLDIDMVYESLAKGKVSLPANALGLSSVSIEMCMSRRAGSTGEFGMQMLNGTHFQAYASDAIRVRSYNDANALVINSAKTVLSTETPNTVSFTYDGTVAKVYINGELLTTAAQTAHLFNFTNVEFGSTYLQNAGSIFGIRVSGRDLTADEIAHNYAVDKERFNLP